MVNKVKKSPSRLRYEQIHPVLSIRVDSETYQRVNALKQKTNKSLATIIKEALNLQEISINEAYEKGYNDAMYEYKFSLPCSICNEEIVVSNNHDDAEAVKELLKKVCHADCKERKKEIFLKNFKLKKLLA